MGILVLTGLVGLLLGGMGAWLVAQGRTREQAERAATAEAGKEAAESALVRERAEREGLGSQLKVEVEQVMGRVLEAKTTQMAEMNRTQVGTELRPILDRMDAFRRRVDEVHTADTAMQSGLRQELQNILQTSVKLGADTQALTSALKNDSGVRGRWGEVILERTLQMSGLEKGREYKLQETVDRKRMDAVVFLPEDHAIVVDSKVPLVDYEGYCRAVDPIERERCLKAHVGAVRRFIDDLSGKAYPDLLGEKSPDFTILFIPIEPAFAAAIQGDENLLEHAFSNRIVLSTPSMLMATLRTIGNVWRVERQNRNVQEIARLGGKLHDDLVNFCGDLMEVGKALGKAQEAHGAATKKLADKKGNIIGTADKLRELGAKTEKKILGMLGDGLETEG